MDHIDKLDHNTFLQSITLPSVTNALKGIPNNKNPGNDGLTKEIYEKFYDELKVFYKSKSSLPKKASSTSYRQAVIKSMEKKIMIKDC